MQQPSTRDQPMPTESECHATRPFKPWLVGCTLHIGHKLQGSALTLRLNTIPVSVLLDSESAITLARPLALTRAFLFCGKLAITCVHGDIREVPVAEVQIGGRGHEWPIMVGLITDLLVPSL